MPFCQAIIMPLQNPQRLRLEHLGEDETFFQQMSEGGSTSRTDMALLLGYLGSGALLHLPREARVPGWQLIYFNRFAHLLDSNRVRRKVRR